MPHCDTTNTFGGTIFYRNVIDSATNDNGGGTGGNYIIFLLSMNGELVH